MNEFIAFERIMNNQICKIFNKVKYVEKMIKNIYVKGGVNVLLQDFY